MVGQSLSEEEISMLAGQVEEQLAELRGSSLEGSPSEMMKATEPGRQRLPSAPVQEAVIEKATGKPFAKFWRRYLSTARRDLCLPGGLLHDHWAKWRDLESKSVVRVSYGWASALGIPSHSIKPVLVASSVFLINALLNIGILAVCAGCAKKTTAKRPSIGATATKRKKG